MTTQSQTLCTGTLSLTHAKAWLAIALFVIGNIALPQLCHLVPQGGLMFLPIYFFTLIAAYRYGWQVGVLTAVLSPVVNSLLFGMPAPAMVPIICCKGILLAIAASYAARRCGRATLLVIAAVVLSYQCAGCAVESLVYQDLSAGFQDFRLGLPGILLQIFGGWAILKFWK